MDLRVIHLLELLALLIQLLLYVIIGLSLELGLDFSTNEITLLLLVQSFVIVVLHELKILLQLLLLSLLLANPGLGPLNLKVNLLLLGQPADL